MSKTDFLIHELVLILTRAYGNSGKHLNVAKLIVHLFNNVDKYFDPS